MPSAASGKAPASRKPQLSPSATTDKPSPSPSKRQKREEHHRPSPSTPQKQIRPDNMYKFSNNIIDLTSPVKSSPSSPPNRKVLNGIRTTAAVNNGAKKLVVKNLRTTKSDVQGYFDTIWNDLSKALDIIFNAESTHISKEYLYRGVENVCRQKKDSELFKKLQARCKAHVGGLREALIGDSHDENDIESLRSVVEAWTLWREQMKTIRAIFYFLDRSYLLHSPELPTLEEFAIQEFRENVLNNSMLEGKVLDGACELVALSRTGSEQDEGLQTLFKNAVNMFHILTTYTRTFEPLLLEKSQAFFEKWAQENSLLSLREYVKGCHGMIKNELSRCDTFGLDDSTKRNLLLQLETWLVQEQRSRLVRSEDVKELLADDNVEALDSLYDLLEKKRLGDDLETPFAEYIREAGEAIIFDEERESEMVIRLLLFKRKLDGICDNAFGKNPNLAHTLREAFAEFINKTKKTKSNWGTNNDKPGEMIAKYVDMILRGGSKAIPESLATSTIVADAEEEDDNDANEDQQMNQQLDQVLDLFRFVEGKAVFEAFYKKDLAKRLLMNRSASADAEKSMLDKLSKACGQGFTQNLETMFRDIELAREENAAYKMIQQESGKKQAIDLSVNILSAAAWPTYPKVDVVIPPEITQAMKDYKKHYEGKHKGRTLDWKHSLAHCQMKARFPGGDKDIIVSSYQALVMLHFNQKQDNEAVTYQELIAATKLPDIELKRTLQSLACAKYRVLSKSPKGKDVNETDTFTVNLSFKDPRTRIKINQIQLKETREENKQTHERIAQDRQYETQAAIVRIMKSKKKVRHAVLVTEVIDALKSRGPVSTDDIKKQIEKLIDKDYMERDEDDTQTYVYIS